MVTNSSFSEHEVVRDCALQSEFVCGGISKYISSIRGILCKIMLYSRWRGVLSIRDSVQEGLPTHPLCAVYQLCRTA